MKGFTARQANSLLHRTGEPFWQHESYDHWVRNHDEFCRIEAYIENNPVRAGLVLEPGDYPWSSARLRLEGSVGGELLADGPAAVDPSLAARGTSRYGGGATVPQHGRG